ncbi:MAG: hypothetical protein ACTS6H_00930 [Candidatus Hodgkinia cicadicola]
MTSTLSKMFNFSLLMKCSNNLAVCCIDHFVRRTLNKSQNMILIPKAREVYRNLDKFNSIPPNDKFKFKQTAESIKCELDWAKVIKGDSVIIGAVDVISTKSWIEGFEFEITSGTITTRILTDKSKLAIAEVRLCALRDCETKQVVTFDRKLTRIGIINDSCRFEANINKMDFLMIKTANVLRVEVLNVLRNDVTSIDFGGRRMLHALSTQMTRKATNEILEGQSFLRKNLLFNLNHKTKEYLKQPVIIQDWDEQFTAMLRRLTNEINDPQLLRANRSKRNFTN